MKFHVQYPTLMPLWLAVYIDILGFTILVPLIPYLAEDYQIPDTFVGFLVATNAIFGLICGPILGWLSDKYGRKPLLLLSMAGTFTGFLVLAFSTTIEMIFLSRLIDGVFGGVFPITKAVIGDIVPPKGRSEQMSNVGVMHILASLIGPGIGGVLYRWGIIAPGLLAAGLTAISFSLTVLYMKETLPTKTAGREQITNILESSPAPTSTQILAPKSGLWRNKTVLFLLLQWGFHTFTFSTYITSISLFGKNILILAPEEMGLLLMFAGIIRVFVRFVIFVPLLNKLGDNKTAILGLVVFVGVFILLAFVNEPVLFSVVLIGTSFAASCTRGPLSGFQSRAVSKREQGKMMGYSSSVENISNIFGPIIGVFILTSFASGWFGAALAVIAAVPFSMSFHKLELLQDREEPTKKLSEAEIG